MSPILGRARSSDHTHSGEFQGLSALLEASDVLLKEQSLEAGLQRALRIFDRHHGAVRSRVVLLNYQTREIELDIATTDSEANPAFRGVTIIERVIESGKPLIVPQLSRDPTCRHSAGASFEVPNEEITCISVPISLGNRAVGALEIDFPFDADRDRDCTVAFLNLAGSVVAHAVKVHRLIEADRQKLADENAHLKEELKQRYDFSNIVGSSGAMRRVYEQVAQVARTNTTVLVRGESGTGKELIANAIHYNSPRAQGPLVKVNCAALPQDLIESELFGYEKGAFTGAHALRKGRFELAAGGTLLLDEVGDLSLSTQVKLLRVLQEREFERLGGVQTIRVNLRLVVSTNRDLEKSTADGTLREDLYYRLNVFPIFVPPLRERKPDIPLLADHFVEKFSRQHQKSVKRISTPAIDMLMSYHWPGNVRELENAVERAVVVCDDQVLHARHLPPTLQTAEESDTTINVVLGDAVAALERDAIQDALKSARGNRAKAARLIGATARVFNYRVRKYGIEWRRFRR
jgi:Nif-specific regulatory protein